MTVLDPLKNGKMFHKKVPAFHRTVSNFSTGFRSNMDFGTVRSSCVVNSRGSCLLMYFTLL